MDGTEEASDQRHVSVYSEEEERCLNSPDVPVDSLLEEAYFGDTPTVRVGSTGRRLLNSLDRG